MLNSVSPGASFEIDVMFKDHNGQAFTGTVPAVFNVRDFNGKLVVSGSGTQDAARPGRWYATITLPENSPIGTVNDKYSLNWTIKGQGDQRTATEMFSVVPTDNYQYLENDKVLIEGSALQDSLIIPSNIDLSEIKFGLRSENGEYVYQSMAAPAPTGIAYDKHIYSVTTPTLVNMRAGDVGLRPYVAEWLYTTEDGETIPEYHFIYVVNTRILMFMNDLKRFVDKARNEDINPNLRYTDIDLAHYVLQGMAKLNFYPPQLTNWSITTLPHNFNVALTYCAAWEALNAQLLAEGQSAFDFSGQSVSLNVDRTPALEAAIGRIESWLEANVKPAKKIFARMGGGSGSGAGVLGITHGPSTNRISNARGILDHMRITGRHSFTYR